MKLIARAFVILVILSFLSAACGNACGGSSAGVAAYVPADAAISGVVYTQPGDMRVMQGEAPENATPSQRMYAAVFQHVDFAQLGISPETYGDYELKDVGFYLEDSFLVLITESDDPETMARKSHELALESENLETSPEIVIEESKIDDTGGITTYAYRMSAGPGDGSAFAYSYATSAHDKHVVTVMEFALPGNSNGEEERGIERVMERSRLLARAENPLSKAPHFVRALNSLPDGLNARMALSFNFAPLAELSEDAAPRELSDNCRTANDELLERFESSVLVVSEDSERAAFQWRIGLDEDTADLLNDLAIDGFDVSSIVGDDFPLAGSASFGSMDPFRLDAEKRETLTETSRCMNLAGIIASQQLAVSNSFAEEDELNAGNVRLMAAMLPISLLRNAGVPRTITRTQFTADEDLRAVLLKAQHDSSRQTSEVVEIDGDEVHVMQNSNGLFGSYEATGGGEFWNGSFAFDSDVVEQLSEVSDDGPPLQIAWSPSSMRSLLTAAELSAKASIRLGSMSIPDGGPLSADGASALIGELFSALKKIDMISFSGEVDDRDVVLEIR